MSKSMGNTVEPDEVISKHGADVLRLWVASTDYTDDIRLNQEILTRTAEAYRKIRNTARFLLSNLFDFDPATNAVEPEKLEPVDRLLVARAALLVADARKAYDRFEFHAVARRLREFATTDLSALWCDVRKDALFVLGKDDPARRSAQTAAYRIAEALALLLNPICPFTAEEIWESLPGHEGTSPNLATWDSLVLAPLTDEEHAAWGRLLDVRAAFVGALEPLRRDGVVGTSAQARAEVEKTADLAADLATTGLDEAALRRAPHRPRGRLPRIDGRQRLPGSHRLGPRRRRNEVPTLLAGEARRRRHRALRPVPGDPRGEPSGGLDVSPVRLRALYLALATLVVLLDQATKAMIRAWVPMHDRIVVISGFFDITHVENTGAAFGLFAGATSPYRPILLNTVAFAVFVLVLVYAFKSPVHWKRLQLALAGILGGAVGNLIDRIGSGAVTDFLRVHVANKWEWPSFNVADSAITVGVVLLALDIWKNPDGAETKPES